MPGVINEKKIAHILIAILSGISIPVIPYFLFVMIVEKVGEEYFNLHPQFIAMILGIILLCLGGYVTGKILGKGKLNELRKYSIVLVTPGLYLGIVGFVSQLLIDGRIPRDGVVAILFISIALICITTPFTWWGYKKNME